jgi:hypothetical protein
VESSGAITSLTHTTSVGGGVSTQSSPVDEYEGDGTFIPVPEVSFVDTLEEDGHVPVTMSYPEMDGVPFARSRSCDKGSVMETALLAAAEEERIQTHRVRAGSRSTSRR